MFSTFLLSGVAALAPLGHASRPLTSLVGRVRHVSPLFATWSLLCGRVEVPPCCCWWEPDSPSGLSGGTQSGGGKAQHRRVAAGPRLPSGLHELHRGGQGSRGVARPSLTPWVKGMGSLVDSFQSGEGRCLSFLLGPCWQGWRRNHCFPAVSGQSSAVMF